MAPVFLLLQVEDGWRLRPRGRCVHKKNEGRFPKFQVIERRTRDSILWMLSKQRELLYVT